MRKFNFKIIVFVGLIIFGALFRLLPHPWNFTPIMAMALFSGTYLQGYFLTAPFLAMLLSDMFLGFYSWKLMIFVYGSFILCMGLGFYLRKNKKWYTILANSLFCSLLFFLATNFAVWALADWYPKTINGLIRCYIMGIPFFRNTILGDLFYVTVFFGVYESVRLTARLAFPKIKKAFL